MTRQDKPILVYTTFPAEAEAERVGGELVDRGLAACVNIVPGMVSIYVWKGERHRDREVVMIIKTRAGLTDQVIAETRRLHPYENPAILVLEVTAGSEPFCRWIAEQTASPR